MSVFDASTIYPSIMCFKSIKGADTSTVISLATIGSTLNLDKQGAILLFSDGTRIEKKEQVIDVGSDSEGWKYSAYIKLNADDLEILSSKLLTDFRLFIYDATIKPNKSERLQDYIKCLIKSK